ncbi:MULTISPECIES: hypothetical protein [Heyndrickxia]|uniref:Uncharacterized protein n=1 Tax=Heyndrickxia coagulans 36D1 TaxID=345219 RepID=G2TN12_HEYCO|nr:MULTISPECIES: hypothetical protein [Heyndrickxia]AEP01314.1 hypothetical protein Bcoa_2130 [Heyndrickxia coagulans 36D1]MBQ4911480.1 hypothetical protein [Heyndrickxia faecalis]MED4976855.1 hypothetical protein [Weizmannia sp. CD-2023]
MPAVVRQGSYGRPVPIFAAGAAFVHADLPWVHSVYYLLKKISISLSRLVRFLFLWQFLRIRDTKLIYGFTGKGRLRKIAWLRLYTADPLN